MNGFKAVLLALGTALVIKLFFFEFMTAQGHSMEPAIRNGSVMVVNRLQYGLRLPMMQNYLIRWGNPKAGDIVVFYTPLGELAVKRCVALTKEGGFIAEGDNELLSYDSRTYGPVPTNNIIGKVLGY
jgi:signal peptidase I